MIRPEALHSLGRASEVIWAGALGLFGAWLVWLGGYLLAPLGSALILLAGIWALQGLRRLRFAQNVAAPGMVEVDEGQIGYLGPDLGGYVSLPELTELRLLTLRGRRLWRLKQADGQALLIPVDASGSDRLYDAFASLPGMDTGALVAALAAQPAQGGRALALAGETRMIWRRPGKGVTLS